MRCIETQGLENWFAYCEASYAQPKYSLVDLCRYVGCAESTTKHYEDVLQSGDYAERRYQKYTTGIFNPEDQLYPLTVNIECNRLQAASTGAVRQRQQQKLESGRYGQFPLACLKELIPQAQRYRCVVEALSIDAGAQEGYLKKALETYRAEYPGHPALDNISTEPSPNVLFESRRMGWWEWIWGMILEQG